MRGMKTLLALSLAALLWPISGQAAEGTVIVYRCVDGKGRVTLQDDACPAGSKGIGRQMLRPRDAPPKLPGNIDERPAPSEPPASEPYYPPEFTLIPPPPMYRCTSYDGSVRYSESYDPNPRCEPLGLYYQPGRLTPSQARICNWVEDSCIHLTDGEACKVWKERQKEAKSNAMHAFSDTAAYRKSELARTNQIIEESCR